MFSPLDTIPAVTDGRTDGHVAVAKTAHTTSRG